MKHIVYGIVDPKDDQVVYVGYTSNLNARQYSHLKLLADGKHSNAQLQNVFNRRSSQGVDMYFRVLYRGSENTAKAAEVGYIKEYGDRVGKRLCNICKMGEYRPAIAAARVGLQARRRSNKNKKVWGLLNSTMAELVEWTKLSINSIHKYGHRWDGNAEGAILIELFGRANKVVPYPDAEANRSAMEYKQKMRNRLNRP